MKIILTLIAALLATGCEVQITSTPVGKKGELTTRCLGGVEYYFLHEDYSHKKGYGYMAPKFYPDGSIATCATGSNTIDN